MDWLPIRASISVAEGICLQSRVATLPSSTLDRSCLRPSPGLPFCWPWDCCYSFWPPRFAVNPPSDWIALGADPISDNAGFPFSPRREPCDRTFYSAPAEHVRSFWPLGHWVPLFLGVGQA